MKRILIPAFALTASPAFAAGDVFFSLNNTDFVVLIAFLIFVGVLLYFRVPSTVAGMLDKRADGIRSDLDEARSLRDEAQALLASYERKQKDVQAQADRIVANAREEAERVAEASRADIEASVERRLAAAEEQIASARAAAVKEVKDRAVAVAVSAAREVLQEQMDDSRQDALIDQSIETVGQRLH